MFYDKENTGERPQRRGEHKHKGGRRGHGRHGLHSGRKLSSGDLQLLLMQLLAARPSHGYELIKSLEERSDGFYVPSPGMIYPALTYLEEIGHASVEVEGNKKLYRLTGEGAAHLRENHEAAENILADLERIGSQMAEARRAFDENADDGQSTQELEAARRGLRRAQREKAPYSPDEAQRIAAILERATADIIGDAPFAPTANLNGGPLDDAAIHRVLSRLLATRPRPPRIDAIARENGGLDAHAMKNFGFSIRPEQGELIYLLCRALNAKRVAELGTSLGFSAIYLAAAVRDNGGGLVIGSELVPEKFRAARHNLAEAGLESLVEIREGDALTTLRDLGEPLDFFLMDGWPTGDAVSLARRAVEIVAPQLRVGALMLNDNSEPDYLKWVRDSKNGFLTLSLPFKRTFELSVKVSQPES